MSETKEDPRDREPIRVVDRRQFTSEGEPRSPDAISEERAEPEGLKPPGAVIASAGPDGVVESDHRSGVRQGAKAENDPGASALFKNLILNIATSAAASMEQGHDPSSQDTTVDLSGARQMIDMLEALQVKTNGNLTPEEDQFLRRLVDDLKLHFVTVQSKVSNSP